MPPLILPAQPFPEGATSLAGKRIWVPPSSTAAERDNLWRCPIPGCEATYGKGQDRAIARHVDTQHEDDIAEMAAQRDGEPLHQIDEEQVAFLRERAQERKDRTVKGVT